MSETATAHDRETTVGVFAQLLRLRLVGRHRDSRNLPNVLHQGEKWARSRLESGVCSLRVRNRMPPPQRLTVVIRGDRYPERPKQLNREPQGFVSPGAQVDRPSALSPTAYDRSVIAAYDPSSGFLAIAGWKAGFLVKELKRRDRNDREISLDPHDALDEPRGYGRSRPGTKRPIGLEDPPLDDDPAEGGPWARVLRETFEAQVGAIPDARARTVAQVRLEQLLPGPLDASAEMGWEQLAEIAGRRLGTRLSQANARQLLSRAVNAQEREVYVRAVIVGEDELPDPLRDQLDAAEGDRAELIARLAQRAWRQHRDVRTPYRLEAGVTPRPPAGVETEEQLREHYSGLALLGALLHHRRAG